MKIIGIVATDRNGLIGIDNDIPWYLSDDLKLFKKHTLHHHILMGRKTFESIGKPLPKRTNVIITRNPMYLVSGCLVVHSLTEALALAVNHDQEVVYLIGGAELFSQGYDLMDTLLHTEVQVEIEVPDDKEGVYFPEWPLPVCDWRETASQAYTANERNDYDFIFKEWERIRHSTPA